MKNLAVAALLLVMGLAGCGTPAPLPVLHSLVPASSATPAATPTVAPQAQAIMVGRIAVPEEVDRPELVLHSAAGGIRLVADQRWSEPLKAQLPRAVALALAQRLPGALTSAYPAPPPAPAAGRLSIEVQRFELLEGPAGRASLRVLWTWRPAAGEGLSAPARPPVGSARVPLGGTREAEGAPISRVAEASAEAAGASPQALVAAMGTALGRIADEIAAAIR